jgi:hypothetical protein
MGSVHDEISPALQRWIEEQHMFFVATAPLAGDGFINCSPKGLDSFRILGPRDVAYLDLTGSGIETIAHLRDNGRIVFMFCAFDGPPRIVRLHGTATVALVGTPEFDSLLPFFPQHLGARAVVRASVTRVSDSCGYAVPVYEFKQDRDTLTRWAERQGADGLVRYRMEKNARSINALPGIDPIDQSD